MCKVNNKREQKNPKKNEMLSHKMVLGSSSVGKKIFQIIKMDMMSISYYCNTLKIPSEE